MRKSNILKGIVIVLILVIGILLYSENISKIEIVDNVKNAISEKISLLSKQIQDSINSLIASEEITIIDVTDLEDKGNVGHEHTFKTMYDENSHWEECTACGEKSNESSHKFTTTWAVGNKESCHKNNYSTSICSCGYKKIGYRPCVWNGSSYNVDNISHTRKCSVCGDNIDKGYYIGSFGNGVVYSADYTSEFVYARRNEFHHTSDGKLLNCANPGYCSVCKRTVVEGEHELHNVNGSIECLYCGKKFGIISENVVANSGSPASYTNSVSINLENGATFANVGYVRNVSSPFSNISLTRTDTTNSKTQIELKATATFYSSWKQQYGIYATSDITINGKKCILYFWENGNLSPDLIKPEITSIFSENGNELSEWSRTKPITIFGTENYCNNVSIKILDDNNNTVFDGSGLVNNKQFSISCTPDIECDVNGRTFKAVVTDACGNSTEQTFLVAKVDSIAPTPKYNEEIVNDWAKSKIVTFSATDSGIGNVSIAFNNVEDFRLANFDGIEYSRNYELIGDVYSQKELSVLYKDGLGNTSIRKVLINKIDNTCPTITSASIDGNVISIISNDEHKDLGEGSGVVGYRYITSIDQISEPIITAENSILVNGVTGEGKFSIDDFENDKYIYLVAIDGVGNISEITTIEIPNRYTIKYNGNGATEGETENSNHIYNVPQNLNSNGFQKEYTVIFKHNYKNTEDVEKVATYTFKSWNTKADGTGTNFNDSSEVKNLTLNDGEIVNLYAMWNPASVSYVPVREGYIFEGWYLDEECTNKVTDNEYTPTEDTILYAKWKKDIDLEETISVEVTKKWVDNRIQALRRPDEIKFIVTQYKEITEDVIIESEEVISNENLDINEKTEESNINNEIEENKDIEKIVEEDTQNLTKTDEEISRSLEETVVLENAYSNELQKSSIINELAESTVPKSLDTEIKNLDSNQEEQVEESNNVNEEVELIQDDNSKLEQEEIAEDNEQNTLEDISTNYQKPEENPNDVNLENQPTQETEKVEIITYEYTMIVNKELNQQLYTLEGLPKYDKETEEEIKYVITEEEVNEGDLKFYEMSGGEVVQTIDKEGNIKYTSEIINTFRLPENNTQNITAIKAWNDNNKISTRPTNIILELIGRIQNIELIEETTEEINEEYIINTIENTGEISNEILPVEYKNISSKEQSVSSTNNWKNTFVSVPIYDENGQEIEYTLQEKAEEGVLDKYIAEIGEINESNEITVTNSLIVQDSKIEKTGTKEINAVDSKINYSIDYTFELDNRYAENAKIEIVDTLPYEIDETKSDLNGGTYSYNEESKIATITWTGTYNPLEKTITWNNGVEEINVKVIENEEKGTYVITAHLEIGITYKDIQIATEKITNKVSGKITLSNEVTDVVEDSFETETRWVKDVVVNKLWKGDTVETRPDSITTQLVSNVDMAEDIQTTTEIVPTQNEEGNTEWTHTWSELPTYDAEGNEIKYTVDETAINYTKGEQTVENEYYCEKTEEIADGKTIVTLTNIKYGSITVEKVDSRKEELKLEGAEFKLEKMIQNENEEWIVPEKTSEDYLVYTGTTGEDGTYTFDELKYGHYKLTETQAPEDYKISEKDIDVIEINEGNADVQVQISNIRMYKLPITGGIGVDTIRNLEVLVGIIVLILITNRKKVVPTRRSKVEARKIKNLEKFAKIHNRSKF